MGDLILKTIRVILSFPKTVYFNFSYLPLTSAIKFPFFIDYGVRLKRIKGTVILNFVPRLFCIKIGVADMVTIDKKNNRTIWDVRGKVEFDGPARIMHSSVISVERDALLTFGSHIFLSTNVKIICNKKIRFGNGVRVSWDCFFMDTDWHDIVNEDGQIINPDKEIVIGNYVWIGHTCTVKKGVLINDWNIIGSNSMVIKNIVSEKQLWAGSPAKLLKEGVFRPSVKKHLDKNMPYR